jgi:hypothetical protein
MKPVLICLWITIHAIATMAAQDAGSEARGRLAWFVYTSMPDGLENPVRVQSGSNITELTLSKRSPSLPVRIPADGILRIVREEDHPQKPGETRLVTLAQAQVPEGVGKALVILIPAAENPGGRLFQAKVQDLAGFKGGDTLYLNMTNVNVGVEIGTSKIGIEPGQVRIQSSPSPGEPTNLPVRYSFFHPVDEQWRILSASTVALYPTRREICIFSWDPRFGRVDYHGITFPVSE